MKAALFLMSLSLVSSGFSQVTTPKSGSPQRKAILDTVRAKLEPTLKKQKIVFKVTHISATKEWAFMSGTPTLSNGKPIVYKGTIYEEAIQQGIFDEWTCALMKMDPKTKKWKIVAWAHGATDVPWDGWDKEFKAPRALFPYGKT